MLIRGGEIDAFATLTPAKELYFDEKVGQKEEVNGLKDVLLKVTNSLYTYKEKLLEEIKPELIEFAFAIAEKIIRHELGQKESLIQCLHALLLIAKERGRKENFQIFLSSEDLALLDLELRQSYFHLESIEWRADAKMKRGDCRIETQMDLLNHSIERELASLKAYIKSHES